VKTHFQAFHLEEKERRGYWKRVSGCFVAVLALFRGYEMEDHHLYTIWSSPSVI